MRRSVPDYVAERIRQNPPTDCFVIAGSTPVLSFGDPGGAWLATIGSNPGRSAFLADGRLTAEYFETLESLAITQMTEASDEQVSHIYDRCIRYFDLPYHRQWFDPQKAVVAALGASYDGGSGCHLDLVQWATERNWTQLPRVARRKLLSQDGIFLRRQLERNPTIELVLLNGDAVFTDFRTIFWPDGQWQEEFSLRGKDVTVRYGQATFPSVHTEST